MNTLSRLCTVFMLAGATSLFAAEGETGTTTPSAPSGGRPGPRMQGRGGHHGPGPGGNFTIMVCPNCHHKLIVLSPGGHGGHGGRDGRDMRDGKGGGRRFRGPEGKGGGFRGPRGDGKGKGSGKTTEEQQTK